MPMPLVVEPAEVATAAAEGAVRIADLRPREHWAAGHPPGAVHVEAALLNRAEPPLAGLLPDRATVERLLAGLALDADTPLVACDAGGSTEAARLVWVLEAYGVERVSWMNGGLAAWVAAGLPLERGESAPPAAAGPPPRALPLGENLVDAETLLGELGEPDLAVLDVRSAAEYAGTDVRAAMGGHVPGAAHLEWTRLLDAEGRLLPDETLRERLAEVGVTADRRTVVYCQSHQRSSVTYVALRHLGYPVRALDGAWSAWGNHPELPKESGGPG